MTTTLLTPENIQNQQFHVRFRGFDVDEVDAFLEKVAENYLVLVKENEKLKEELSAIQVERDQVQTQERTFKNAIISAQTIADEMQAKAQQEAHVLKENARLEAQQLLDEAQGQESMLQEQISSLLLEKQKLKDELAAFLNAHLERLDSQYPDAAEAGAASRPAESGQASMIGDIGGGPKTAPEPAEEPTAEGAPETAPVVADDEPVFREAPETAEEEDDLSELYEKIDLSEIGDNGLVEEMPEAAQAKPASDFATDELDDLELNMPDLDGDMLFSLNDPLDEEPEPAVTIDPLSQDDEDKN